MDLAICSQSKFHQVLGDAIITALQQEGGICLASGDTLRRTYQYVAEQYQQKAFPLRATIVGLDEWVGFGQEDEGSCQYYMHQDLYQHLPLKSGQLHEFDALQSGSSLEEECKKMNELLSVLPLNLMILGIGQNGHLGLNEPGASFTAQAHITQLSPATMRVAQKYFPDETVLTEGITLGIGNMLASKKIFLVANGKHKRNIVQQLIFSEVNEALPATSIKIHGNATLLITDDVFNVETLI